MSLFKIPWQMRKTVFISGATGYMGKRLVRRLLERGHKVIALVRKGSEYKVPAGAEIIIADPFDANSFQLLIPRGSVFIQLLGVAHPSPKKAQLFREIDLKSLKASVDAAIVAKVSNFIYVSVAMTPSKLMYSYQQVRMEGEEYCLNKSLNCTFVRPWYVLGPGHWWPVALYPFYGIAELVPSWKTKARSMALITIKQMIATLIKATEEEPAVVRVLEIKDIRKTSILT
jgi:nucleoside-diphosphate-sugar epimerase